MADFRHISLCNHPILKGYFIAQEPFLKDALNLSFFIQFQILNILILDNDLKIFETHVLLSINFFYRQMQNLSNI